MELTMLASVRILVEKHMPKEYRSKFSWRQLAGLLKRRGGQTGRGGGVGRALDRAAARGRPDW
jgi:hypothetical protein